MNITEKVQRLYQTPTQQKVLTTDQELLAAEFKENKPNLNPEVLAFIENTVAKYSFFKDYALYKLFKKVDFSMTIAKEQVEVILSQNQANTFPSDWSVVTPKIQFKTTNLQTLRTKKKNRELSPQQQSQQKHSDEKRSKSAGRHRAPSEDRYRNSTPQRQRKPRYNERIEYVPRGQGSAPKSRNYQTLPIYVPKNSNGVTSPQQENKAPKEEYEKPRNINSQQYASSKYKQPKVKTETRIPQERKQDQGRYRQKDQRNNRQPIFVPKQKPEQPAAEAKQETANDVPSTVTPKVQEVYRPKSKTPPKEVQQQPKQNPQPLAQPQPQPQSQSQPQHIQPQNKTQSQPQVQPTLQEKQTPPSTLTSAPTLTSTATYQKPVAVPVRTPERVDPPKLTKNDSDKKEVKQADYQMFERSTRHPIEDLKRATPQREVQVQPQPQQQSQPLIQPQQQQPQTQTQTQTITTPQQQPDIKPKIPQFSNSARQAQQAQLQQQQFYQNQQDYLPQQPIFYPQGYGAPPLYPAYHPQQTPQQQQQYPPYPGYPQYAGPQFQPQAQGGQPYFPYPQTDQFYGQAYPPVYAFSYQSLMNFCQQQQPDMQ